ncbi:GNAT family N-acetyltransferase [Deinococcus aestuarii]|uniref:GNAT family N-acetyltransferase n=1 Tax=Deinococcus aestuarii TaxID=2774531 RepID=UPI001C0BF4F4|nr:GNAT family N-acetyltransferase [Deinococcus aestuarii]
MTAPLQIRPARPFDAAFAVPLMQATIGRIGLALTGAESDTGAARVLLGFFPLRDNRLSHTHTLIAEGPGRPLGLAVAYPGSEAQALDAPFRERLRALGLPDRIDPEATPGELYLDTLAVVEEARGQGVGGRLLGAVAARARELGLSRVGLLAGEANPAARLYERHGYRAAGERVVAGGRYRHLVLELT